MNNRTHWDYFKLKPVFILKDGTKFTINIDEDHPAPVEIESKNELEEK